MSDLRTALAFRRIGIDRMDGIREPFAIEDLSPGINLIYGPNGVGKTRTAIALQALIWPEMSSNRAELLGQYSIADQQWDIRVERGSAHHRSAEGLSGRPGLAAVPASHSNRYLLTLHDLLYVNNHDFVDAVRREIAGGYDLGLVRDEMGLKPDLRLRNPTMQRNKLQDAEGSVRELQLQNQQLMHREASLAGLEAELQSAIDAATRVSELDAALEFIAAKEKVRDARIARNAFEDPIGDMVGDEFERLQALEADYAAELDRLRNVEAAIQRANQRLEQTGFADEMPTDSLITELRDRVSQLHQLEQGLQQVQQQIVVHGAREHELRKRVGGWLTDSQMAALGGQGLRELEQVTREWQRAADAAAAMQQLRTWLGSPVADDLERIRQGISVLARYVRAAHADDGGRQRPVFRYALIGGAVVIVIEAVLLSIAWSPALLILALLAGPLVWLALNRNATEPDVRLGNIQQEYTHLGLGEPETWSIKQVERHMTELFTRRAAAEVEHEKASRWGSLESQHQNATERLHAATKRYGEVTARLGIELPEAGPESLRRLADDVDQWQHEHDQLQVMQHRERAGEERIAAALNDINGPLEMYGERSARDGSSARARIEHLANRLDEARRLRTELDHGHQQKTDDIEPRLKRLENDIRWIFERAGLAHGDDASLRSMSDRVEPCRQAQQALVQAEATRDAARSRLAEGVGDEHRSREEIEEELLSQQERASRQQQLRDQISAIHAELDVARRETRLEEALAAAETARDELVGRRADDLQHAAGWHLFNFIQHEQRDVNRPMVLRKADHLFTTFTHGHYCIELGTANEDEFLARHTASQRLLQLDELSSGTRVQLLMAVRLAFIAEMEQGVRLPLILDEALGNTDDTRALEIVEAVTHIAREERQVIYFTAQQDEVQKWQTYLAVQPDGPPFKLHDLAFIRGRSRIALSPLVTWDEDLFTGFTAVPEGVEYEDLRAHFHVPAVDFWAESVDGVDVWYMIPDAPTLVELRERRVTTWGQYMALYRQSALNGVGSPAIHERAVARSMVMETARREWQRGRPRPVTKACLEQSGQISDRFWNEVIELAAEGEWNGAVLIEALRERRVSNFRQSNVEDLERFFLDNGYMSDTAPEPDHMIWARARSVAHDAIERDVLDAEEVEKLLMSMTGEPVTAS